jgi:hypothetical protein
VRAWGAPQRSGKLADGAEVHTWLSEGSAAVHRSGPSVGFGGFGGSRGSGVGVGVSVPIGQDRPVAVARCERTLTFREGKLVEQSWIGADEVCTEYTRPKK